MPMIGVRELRERTAEILRHLREGKTEYIITYRGRPIALLLPLAEPWVENIIPEKGKQHVASGWDRYARLAEELRQSWPQDQETQALLDEIRQS